MNSRSALILGLCVATAGVLVLTLRDLFAQSPLTPGVRVAVLNPLEVLGVPSPQQMMRVEEGTPFTVPTGKLLVITGLASNGFTFGNADKLVQLSFGSQPVIAAMLLDWQGGGSYTGGGPAVSSIPPALVAQAGVVVSVQDPTTDLGIALGYLVDA